MERWQLKQLQTLSLRAKIARTERKIREWHQYWEGDVYVSVSGKDSTVLLHIVRSLFPKVPGVFVNTGLEYPEILEHIKSLENITWLKPKMNFRAVIEKYGYPVISKEISMGVSRHCNTKSSLQKQLRLYGGINPTSGKKQYPTISKKWHFLINAPFKCSERCCDVMKKRPVKQYERETERMPMTGVMASEGHQRERNACKYGCNAFNLKRPHSEPLQIWNEADVWAYIKEFRLSYAKVYDMGYDRTGCMFCMFGVHMEKGQNRFQKMYRTHPKQWKFCMDKLGLRDVLEYIGIPCEPTPTLFETP